jgi:hypothetical protein
MLHVEHYLVCTSLEICLRAKPVIVVQDGQAQILGSIVLMLILSKNFRPQGSLFRLRDFGSCAARHKSSELTGRLRSASVLCLPEDGVGGVELTRNWGPAVVR